MNFSEAQADTPNDILRWRRDVRHFRADPIPEPVLDRLSAAMDLGIQTTGAQCTDMAGHATPSRFTGNASRRSPPDNALDLTRTT